MTTNSEAVLYVVATPLGNMDDLSPRAAKILSEVEVVLCEDTRYWRKIASKHGIDSKYLSYHDQNEKYRSKEAIELLNQGLNLALVSDAGTPTISDPGYRIIKACYENQIRVSPIPGPSAIIAALSASGLELDQFKFLGFVPHKPGKRQKLLESALAADCTTVFYESPHRILKTLSLLAELEPERTLVVARELTKKFEEISRDTASNLALDYNSRKQIKGEFVVMMQRNKP